MRVETKTTTKNYYVCDCCNRKHLSEESALHCERRSGCEHKESNYSCRILSGYDGEGGEMEICQYCSNCNKHLGDRVIDTDAIAEEILKILYHKYGC